MFDISVVIPTYKEEKYIINTLRKLSEQTIFSKIQIVIADYDPDKTGATIKATKTLAPAIQKHIKIVNINKAGIGIARHEGVMQADGRYIVNLDADCYFARNTDVEKMVLELGHQNYNNVDNIMVDSRATHCTNVIADEDLTSISASRFNLWYVVRNAMLTLYRLPICYEPGFTMTKDTYIRSGGFRDVKQFEGPLLSADITMNFGIYSLRFVPDVCVMVSARRGVGSDPLLFDFNYDHAYR